MEQARLQPPADVGGDEAHELMVVLCEDLLLIREDVLRERDEREDKQRIREREGCKGEREKEYACVRVCVWER